MYRKRSTYSQGRRSSGPKRLSAAIGDTEDKSNKNVSDGKKSFIPRPTAGSSRSSSVERDGARGAARVTNMLPRSTSAEQVNVEDNRRISDFRGRNNENLITPNHLTKTPGASVRKTTVSVQRTVRKDTRPLTDRGFQMAQLATVQEYLVTKKIISQGQDLCNSMTLKLFVQIMNSLLVELGPSQTLTLSNYSELIPLLMRKLKYPGYIPRSLLVTANSSHSWPNVLGLFSWLIDLLNFHSLDIKFVVDDEDFLDNDRVTRLFTYGKQRYIEWSENDIASNSEEDTRFFDDLILDLKKPLEQDLSEFKKEVECLQDLVRQTESPEEQSAEERFKIVKTDLEKMKSARTGLEERLLNMQNALEKKKNETQALLNENEGLKKCAVNDNCSNSCKAEDIPKLQSEVVSHRNIIKLQDTHILDISNQCYASDLTNARLQGKLDEVRLQRGALLRQCTSEFVDESQLQFSLNYGNEDNSKIVSEYLTYVKKRKDILENISKEYSEKEKLNKIHMNEADEKFKFCKSEISNRQAELQQYDQELMDRRPFADLECQLNIVNEEYSKVTEKLISLEHVSKSQSDRLHSLEAELKDFDNTITEQTEHYKQILKHMANELLNHVKRCQENIKF